MKIKLIHSAQVVEVKRTEQHPPGTELKTDDAQGARLVANGYATEVNAEEPDGGPGPGAGGPAAPGPI